MSFIRLKRTSFVCTCRIARPSGCLLASRVALESNTAVSLVNFVPRPISLMTRSLTRPLTRRLSKPRAGSATSMVCRPQGVTTTRSVYQLEQVANTLFKVGKVGYVGYGCKVGNVRKVAKIAMIDRGRPGRQGCKEGKIVKVCSVYKVGKVGTVSINSVKL